MNEQLTQDEKYEDQKLMIENLKTEILNFKSSKNTAKNQKGENLGNQANILYIKKLEQTIRDIKLRVRKFLISHLNNNLSLQDVIHRLDENGSLLDICQNWERISPQFKPSGLNWTP